MSIVMTGGGTGGHLAIIRAVKEQLVLRQAQEPSVRQAQEPLAEPVEVIYIGSTKGQDRQWFEEDSDFSKTYFLETRGVVNQGLFGKFKSLFKILTSSLEVRKILKEHKASVVFSVGGFSAAPAAIAANI